MRVKKQFHETLKIQERQYKMLRKQMLANAPREQHREIIQKFKDDRMRKFADLGSQYDQSISDLLQKQKVKLIKILCLPMVFNYCVVFNNYLRFHCFQLLCCF